MGLPAADKNPRPEKSSSSSRSTGTKSVLCRFYAEGRCTRGKDCSFSHKVVAAPAESGDKRRSPGTPGNAVPSSSGSVKSASTGNVDKNKPCFDFVRGKCTRENCRFAHVDAETAKKMGDRSWIACKRYIEEGSCSHGDKCKNAMGRRKDGSVASSRRSSGTSNRSDRSQSPARNRFSDRGRPRQRQQERDRSPSGRSARSASSESRRSSSAGSKASF